MGVLSKEFKKIIKKEDRLPLYISYKDQGALHLEWHQGTQTGPLVEPVCYALFVPETASHLSKILPAKQKHIKD